MGPFSGPHFWPPWVEICSRGARKRGQKTAPFLVPVLVREHARFRPQKRPRLRSQLRRRELRPGREPSPNNAPSLTKPFRPGTAAALHSPQSQKKLEGCHSATLGRPSQPQLLHHLGSTGSHALRAGHGDERKRLRFSCGTAARNTAGRAGVLRTAAAAADCPQLRAVTFATAARVDSAEAPRALPLTSAAVAYSRTASASLVKCQMGHSAIAPCSCHVT